MPLSINKDLQRLLGHMPLSHWKGLDCRFGASTGCLGLDVRGGCFLSGTAGQPDPYVDGKDF